MARPGSQRATTSQLVARHNEPRAITNLIEYIDLYEVPYRLRVQLKLSSYRLVVTTRIHSTSISLVLILLFSENQHVTLLVGS